MDVLWQAVVYVFHTEPLPWSVINRKTGRFHRIPGMTFRICVVLIQLSILISRHNTLNTLIRIQQITDGRIIIQGINMKQFLNCFVWVKHFWGWYRNWICFILRGLVTVTIYCKSGYNEKGIYIDNENINIVHLVWKWERAENIFIEGLLGKSYLDSSMVIMLLYANM